MRVMMSAAGSAVAPPIIRHLQSLGHYVIGHDSCPYGAGASVCDEFFQSPAVGKGYADTIHAFPCDFYLPFLDEELPLCRLMPCIRMPAETIHIFTRKTRQQRALQDASLPVAPAVNDLIFKPDCGRGGKGQLKLEGAIAGIVVQQVIHGDEYTVDVLTGLDGAFLFAVPRLRIQANGVSVIGQIEMNQEIIDLAMRVVGSFKFAGPINIQIIRERDTGELYIIEVNARLSGSCMFTVMAGFDILDATIKLWSGKAGEIVIGQIEDGLIIRRHYVEERL